MNGVLTNEDRMRAFVRRDATLDGRFYAAVRTTGIYCVASCPAKRPRPQNVLFFGSRADAESAGFRACKRCRPELAAGRATLDRRLTRDALGLIERDLASINVPRLAAELGVTERRLQRAIARSLAETPSRLIRRRRVEIAMQLRTRERAAPRDAARRAGFRSTSTYYAAVRAWKRERGSAPGGRR